MIVDMITDRGNLHLEIQISRKSPVGVLRTSFREKGKVKHTQHGRITGCTLAQLKLIQLAFNEKVIPVDDPEAFEITDSREYGASRTLADLAHQLELPQMLYSRRESWVNAALAMIIGRIIYPGSKLSLCHQQANSCLWEACGVQGIPDVDEHCYAVMDKLLQRQKAVQKKLAKKHLYSRYMVLYDITSVYFEGAYEGSELVKFGYNRDRKRSKEQVVVGLICNDGGCPVGVEVFAGNTKDETTVLDKIREIRNDYGLDEVIFVGDRGMLTKSNLTELRDDDDVKTITALTHGDIQKLLERQVIAPDLFDETLSREVLDPDSPDRRYCLCRNEATAWHESETRDRLLSLTATALDKIAGYRRKTTSEKLGARVGKVLAKYKTGKFIHWSVEPAEQAVSAEHRLVWARDEDRITREKRLDGCYVICTDVPSALMDTQRVVDTYKDLKHVEQAFRTLKTADLHMRPVYHKTDDRIRSHIFLCMLSYYLEWHLLRRLKPLFEADGQNKDRRWTLRGVIASLAQITRNKVKTGEATFYRNSKPTEEQQKILSLLGTAL
jgi:transposase